MTPSAATRLPEVFFWAPRKELPRFVKPFVEPGHETKPAQPRLLDAPPKLELPASEPAALSIPRFPDSREALRLVTPPALPVQTSEPQSGTPQTGVSADRTSGDPTNLLSLALDPQRMREFLSVPPGNQLGQLPEGGAAGPAALTAASGGGGGNTGSGPGAGGGSNAATPAPAPASAAKPVEPVAASPAPADAAKPVEPAAASPAPADAAKPVEPAAASPALASAPKPVDSAAASRAPADAADGGAASAAALRAMALAAAAPTRIVNLAGGVFDVVVQSAGTEGFPESAGALSGKPIYSAYVRAGGGKDWLLQYCIPAAEDVVADVSGYVVRLTTGAPLIAPYPRVTMRPPVKPRPGRHVMVHGYVTAEGRFRGLKVLSGSGESEAEMVRAVLDQWEFRAASRDGKPVEVEVLLAIPAE